MNLIKKFPALASSADPTKVSLRVKTALTMFIPIILFIAQLKGWDIDQEGIAAIIVKIAEWVGNVVLVVGGVIHAYAWVRALKKK